MTTKQMHMIRRLLTGGAILGLGSTVILTVRATKKVMDDLAYRNVPLDAIKEDPITVVKLEWKNLLPPLLTSAATVGCIIGTHRFSTRMYSDLIAVYHVSETALKEFKETTAEVVGDKKMIEIKDRLAEKHLDQVHQSDLIDYLEGEMGGQTLFYDAMSGRRFRSNLEAVRKAINDYNHLLLTQSFTMTLNDFYDMIGLRYIELGTRMGWSANHPLEVYFSSTLHNGEPCIVMEPEQIFLVSEL